MEIDREAVLQTFVREADEQLTAIEEALVALESRPEDPELLQAVFRMAHTFKGNALCVGLETASAFAHTVEDVLERVRDRTLALDRELTTLLLDSVDALRQMVPRALEGIEEPQPAQAALVEWLGRRHAATAAAAPAEAGRNEPPPRVSFPPPTDRRTLRVETDKLDRILNLTGEIAIARGRLSALLETEGAGSEALRDAHRDADRLYLELQELVMKARMVPVGPTFRQHVRTVRDVCLSRDKQASLVIEGSQVEVDTSVVESIRDPLTHLVRNAVDHGIEAPEVRVAHGKDQVGRITLRAAHESGRVIIEVRDDGAGLDRARIATRARELGLVSDPERLAPGELEALILEPGFSTARELTEISGRGVGLDVVRKAVEALRGTLTIRSEPGVGTTFTLALPLTLAIIEGFSVAVGTETYVLPLEAVAECVEMPAEERGKRLRHGVLNLRGQPLPYLRLGDSFQVPAGAGGRESVVVVRQGELRAGIVVDALLGEGQTVVRPLPKLFRGAASVAGSALLGSGRVALILDVGELLRQALAESARTHEETEKAA